MEDDIEEFSEQFDQDDIPFDSLDGIEHPGQSQQRKKRLLKKAPDAPKRFKSAYICFVTDKMDDVKKSLPSDVKVRKTSCRPFC